jgi:autotransporter-associated beta strand protein
MELLEPRWSPATFNVSDVAGLLTAINAAGANADPANVIELASGTYAVTNQLIQVAQGQTLAIIGQGSGATLQSNGQGRVLEISGNVLLENLTIEDGIVQAPAEGGGLLVDDGQVALVNVNVSNNAVYGGQSAARGSSTSWHVWGPGGSAMGGGIYLAGGSLTLISSSVDYNQAIGSSGLGYGLSAAGGGIAVAGGAIVIADSSIDDNIVRGAPGGDLFPGAPNSGPVGGDGGLATGGGIYVAAASATLIDGETCGNMVTGGGGGNGGIGANGDPGAFPGGSGGLGATGGLGGEGGMAIGGGIGFWSPCSGQVNAQIINWTCNSNSLQGGSGGQAGAGGNGGVGGSGGMAWDGNDSYYVGGGPGGQGGYGGSGGFGGAALGGGIGGLCKGGSSVCVSGGTGSGNVLVGGDGGDASGANGGAGGAGGSAGPGDEQGPGGDGGDSGYGGHGGSAVGGGIFFAGSNGVSTDATQIDGSLQGGQGGTAGGIPGIGGAGNLSGADGGYGMDGSDGTTDGEATCGNVTAATPGAATQLVFVPMPPVALAGTLPFPVYVVAEDANGMVDTSFNANVTVSNGPASYPNSVPLLSGTLTVPANGGVAVFSNLAQTVGEGTLQATSGELQGGSNAFTVLYNRDSAVDYAELYANYVCSDGYFWESVGNPVYLGELAPVPTEAQLGDHHVGDDCAHFVSCCIGSEPNVWGGGLFVPNNDHPNNPNVYGDAGAQALTDWLLHSGTAVEEASVDDLSPGDVITYNWDGNTSLAAVQHVALYLGNGEIAAHSRSHCEVAWKLSSKCATHFLHILDGGVTPLTIPTYSAPDVTISGGTTATVSLTFADSDALDVSTLNSNNVLVTGPNGYSQLATYLGADSSSNGAQCTATYQVTAPGGTWGPADNGTYDIIVQPGQVGDTSGNYLPLEMAGTFTVNIPLYWTGGAGSTSGWWDDSSQNWTDGSSPATFCDSDQVTFDDTHNTGGISTVVVQSTVTPATVTVDTANSYTIDSSSNPIAGASTTLTTEGPGTLLLLGTNTYGGGTSVDQGLLVAEGGSAIPSGSLLAVGPGGSVVLGDPGASEPLAATQAPGAGQVQVAVAAAGPSGTEPASLVASGASVMPAGGGRSAPAAGDAVLAAAAAVPTAAVALAAVDRLLATQPLPESTAVATAIVGRSSSDSSSALSLPPSGWPSARLRASAVPHSDAAAANHAGGQPTEDEAPRVGALRTAASGEARDEVLLRIAEARSGNATWRAGNQHPATGFFGLDLPTLDVLAAAATKRQ